MSCLFAIRYICSIISVTVALYIQSNLLHRKINFKDLKIWVKILIISIFVALNSLYMAGFVKFLVSTFIMTLTCYLIFKENFLRLFTIAVIQQLILFISELILSVLMVISRIDLWQVYINTNIFFLMMNICISIIAVLFYKINYINLLLDKIINYIDKIEGQKKYFLIVFFVMTLNILLLTMYFGSENKIVVFVNMLFIVVYTGIVYLLLNEKNENIRFKEENQSLICNLNEYEKMLDYQRVSNHENKNQLMVIRGMIHKNNKKALDYIDEIINATRSDNETLYTKTKRIPSGGLQGLIYQKMLYMQDKQIEVELEVGRNLRKLKFNELPSKTNYDICRAVGIIIDNAIEETLKLKNKQITISLYNEDNIFAIEIANHFKDTPDLEKLDDKGYTTKSKGHGYGLTLLRQIVSSNENITNERMIVKDVFIQIIKIKVL